MNLKLRKDQLPAAATPHVQPAQTIEGWLTVLAGMLPGSQAQSVRDELETHLRDRVHDLMVGGMKEAEAMRVAIAEVGEAADLAAKYRALQNEPKRRLVMYGSVLGIAGAALVVSVTSLLAGGKAQPQPPTAATVASARAADERIQDLMKQNQDLQANTVRLQAEHDQLTEQVRAMAAEQARTIRAAVFEPAQPGGPHAAEVNQMRFDAGIRGLTVVEAIKAVAKLVDRPVEFDERALEMAQVNSGAQVTISMANTTLPEVMKAIAERAEGNGGARLDYRVSAQAGKGKAPIRISTRSAFDKSETRLVSYDLSDIIAHRMVTFKEERPVIVEEVAKLVCEFVSPEDWRNNGGELANLTITGDHMFVSAPERMHPQVKWMLEQLASRAAGSASVPFLRDIPILGRVFTTSQGPNLKVYPLQHVEAIATAEKLRAMLGEGETGIWSVTVDARSNSLVVNGSEAQHQRVVDMLKGMGEQSMAGEAAVKKFVLRVVPADVAAKVVEEAFVASPALRRDSANRHLDVDPATNAIVMKGLPDQLAAAEKLLNLIDQPAPPEFAGEGAKREFVLHHIPPTTMRQLLGRIFDISPNLKRCAVPREMACDDTSGVFGFTATKDQVDAVDRLIAVMDRSGGGR